MNKLTFPDWLTVLRFVLTIPIVICLVVNTPLSDSIALGCYILAALSDYFDGFLARKWNQVGEFGKFFDPLADKFLVTSILLVLMHQKILVEPWLVAILLNRDLIVGGVRSLAATKGKVISAGKSGKWKTALQLVLIPLLVLGFKMQNVSPWFTNLYVISYGLLWFTAVLSLTSAWEYVKVSLK
jgi:CDP-diacylglycerol--glycerol-3-phosphate 3-phosphatidyltransferase